jgi:hypothetical protein
LVPSQSLPQNYNKAPSAGNPIKGVFPKQKLSTAAAAAKAKGGEPMPMYSRTDDDEDLGMKQAREYLRQRAAAHKNNGDRDGNTSGNTPHHRGSMGSIDTTPLKEAFARFEALSMSPKSATAAAHDWVRDKKNDKVNKKHQSAGGGIYVTSDNEEEEEEESEESAAEVELDLDEVPMMRAPRTESFRNVKFVKPEKKIASPTGSSGSSGKGSSSSSSNSDSNLHKEQFRPVSKEPIRHAGASPVARWHELFDDGGNRYFFNEETTESQWEAPEWVEEIDPDSGASYYIKQDTSTAQPLHSTWSRPEQFARVLRADSNK